jgi:hypothetical protein
MRVGFSDGIVAARDRTNDRPQVTGPTTARDRAGAVDDMLGFEAASHGRPRFKKLH